MNEPEVVRRVHRLLAEEGISKQPVVRLFTDVHGSLLPFEDLKPFQRFTLDMKDFVLHPDLVGQLGDGETMFAVEAKGSDDLLKGLAQAEMYQAGFHYSFLAADSSALVPSLVEFARRKNLGVISVADQAAVIHLPEAQMPLRGAYQFVARQMETTVQVSGQQAFTLNIPTHYMVWAIAMTPGVVYHMSSLPGLLLGYPMPQSWRSALAGAQRLGLVAIHGNDVRLTRVGAAVKDVLPPAVADWARVHAAVGAGINSVPLAKYLPQAGAILRLLVLQESSVRLIIEGLESFRDKIANFAQLASACDRIDHARAPIVFLKPESAARLMDGRGRIHWEVAQGEDYRSTTFYQYKSILKHAGILAATKLGSQSAKHYEPNSDVWTLV